MVFTPIDYRSRYCGRFSTSATRYLILGLSEVGVGIGRDTRSNGCAREMESFGGDGVALLGKERPMGIVTPRRSALRSYRRLWDDSIEAWVHRNGGQDMACPLFLGTYRSGVGCQGKE